MINEVKANACDFCQDEPATTLCPECCKCYCDECNGLAHRKGHKKGHKTESIPKGVDIKATCSIHKNSLEMLCIDEVKLCCPMCVVKELHKGHRVADITEIEQDNEAFSAVAIRKDFTDTLERSTTLSEKIDEITEDINKEMNEAKKKIERTFEEERKKLNDEEIRLLNELEETYTKATERLNEFKAVMENANEYSTVLSEVANAIKLNGSDKDKKCSRLMELNIVSEMEEQRKKIEKLLGAEMRDLKISWDREARKLSFTRNLFNGVSRIKDVSVNAISWDEMEVSWEVCGDEGKSDDEIKYAVEMRKEGEMDWKETKSGFTDKKCRVRGLMGNSAYEVRVKCVAKGGTLHGEWSDVVKGKTPKIYEKVYEKAYEGVWKECPDGVDNEKKYSVDEKNTRIATKSNGNCYCTIIGDTVISPNTVTSWSVKVLKSMENNGYGIMIGIAPPDINQNERDNQYKCGWYLDCGNSTLWSGPPHSYRSKEYGPRKEAGQCVRTGDSVGVVVDTTKGDLSFVLNGVNRGVAYCGIPLDKPLIPCVLLYYQGDFIELIFS